MAETKPHEPTPNWIARAKREGNVARSQELCGLCAVLAGAAAIAALMPPFAIVAAGWLGRAAADGGVHLDAVLPLFGLLATALLVAGIGGVTASLLQERPFFVFPKLRPERLNPIEGVKRMFSRQAAVSAARAVLAFGLAAAALVPTARECLCAARVSRAALSSQRWQRR